MRTPRSQTLYDPLDLSSDSYDPAARAEAIELSTALLIYYLLRGRTPLLSQTQAFDSPTVLAAAAEGATSPDFRWLVRRGHIRVALFRAPSVIDAFAAKLDDRDFVFLSWPELNSGHASVDRAEVKAVLRGRHAPGALPSAVQARIAAIRGLDRAVRETMRPAVARPAGVSLSARLAYARTAVPVDSPVAPVLQMMVDLKSDQWSRHFTELNRMALDNDIKLTALGVLDACYNLVLGDSLRAGTNMLRSPSRAAIDIMARSVSSGVRQNGYVSLDPGAVKDVEQVGWKKTREFIQRTEELSMTERDRQAAAGRLIAEVAVAGGRHLGLAPLFDGLYRGTIAGLVSTAVSLAASPKPVSRRRAAIAFVGGFLTPFATTVAPIRPLLEEREIRGLEARYAAMLARPLEK